MRWEGPEWAQMVDGTRSFKRRFDWSSGAGIQLAVADMLGVWVCWIGWERRVEVVGFEGWCSMGFERWLIGS